MENVMTNGFCELNEQEMIGTEGGSWISFWEGYGAYIHRTYVTDSWVGKQPYPALDHKNETESYRGFLS